MREFEADILSGADGDNMPDGKCVHEVYLKYEVDAHLAELAKERAKLVAALEPYIHWDCDHSKPGGCIVEQRERAAHSAPDAHG